MFKLIVVCAFFAAAAADPSALLYQTPITQYSTIVQPATTSIFKADTSVIHPTPINYYSPLAYSHFIKKRSAQFIPSSYWTIPEQIDQVHTPYAVPIPTINYDAPALHNVHLIKKRAAILPTTYLAPSTYAAAGAPLLTTSYAAGSPLISSTQFIPTAPLIPAAYPYQFIKK